MHKNIFAFCISYQLEQITPKLNHLKYLLSVSMGQESRHSLAGCLWHRWSWGCSQAVSWGCDLTWSLSRRKEDLFPSSRWWLLAGICLSWALHRAAPSITADFPQSEWHKRLSNNPQDGSCSLLHNQVSEVTSRNFCSILSRRSKSLSPALSEKEEIDVHRCEIIGDYCGLS